MIDWTVDREIFSIGFITIRYYSMMFLIAFLLGMVIAKKMFKAEGRPPEVVDDLLVYTMIGTVIGARLGHVLFYDASYYFSNPLEILKVWKGGLASHGGTIGVILALYLFVRKNKEYNFLWLLDRIAIICALAGFFIRMGNLFNSEIYGNPTDVPWAFKFSKYVDNIPRHPTQLYEALAYLIFFFILYKMYLSRKEKSPPGFFLGLFLILIFGFRIFVEHFKVVQKSFEEGMLLNMGQILSIPFVIAGIYFMITSRKRPLPVFAEKKEDKKKAHKKVNKKNG